MRDSPKTSFLCVPLEGRCSDVHLEFGCARMLTWVPSSGSPVGPVPRCLCIPAMSPGLPQGYLLSLSAQILGLQGTKCLVVFSPALSPQNDLPASTPASKSCDSSPPQDASTPGPSSASHLRQLAAKPAPSTDSIGESLLPSGEFLKMGVERQEVWLIALALPCHFHDSELDTASLWASCFFIVLA